MITLVLPDQARYDDWKAAVEEFAGTPMDGSGFHAGDVRDTSPAGFETYLADRARQQDRGIKPDSGRVHSTYFWVLDDGELVGFLALRQALTPVLLAVGGHIGYSVRPTARGRGVARAALRLGLAEAARQGVDPVLVCCRVENDASRAVIESCGGVFDGIRTHPGLPGATRRYWFGTPPWPTSPTA